MFGFFLRKRYDKEEDEEGYEREKIVFLCILLYVYYKIIRLMRRMMGFIVLDQP